MNFQNKSGLYRFVLPGVFFVLFYLYFWLWIQPVLFYQSQQPVFFFDSRFFNSFLSYPGGLAEYAGAFLSQLYYFSWAGALLITFLAWLLYFETSVLIKWICSVKSVRIVHFIPSMMLLSMHSRYHHSLAVTLGMILMLGFLILYIRISRVRPLFSLIFYLILAGMVHYLAGGHFLFFALLCSLIELVVRRRYLLAILYALSALILPCLGYADVYITNLRDAYLYLLPFEHKYRFVFGPAILYCFYPVIILAGLKIHTAIPFGNFTDFFSGAGQKIKLIYQKGRTGFQIFFLLLTAAVVAFYSFESEKKPLLQICYYARQQMWDNVLTAAQKKLPPHILAQYHVNRALYHTRRLPEHMLDYSQDWGVSGLILPLAFITAPLQKSDIYFELGYMNEAHRWAHEALTILGDTPWTLQQLALINIFKKEPKAAQKYFDILKRTVLFRKWAQRYEGCISDNGLLIRDDRLRQIGSRVNRVDFISRADTPVEDLETLLENNPANKMAFEYLMAAYLLTGQIGKLSKQINRLKDFDYPGIPKLYEEALFLYLIGKNPEALKENTHLFHRDTLIRFQGFQQILAGSGQNREIALKELKKSYGNSYWFYALQKNLKLQ